MMEKHDAGFPSPGGTCRKFLMACKNGQSLSVSLTLYESERLRDILTVNTSVHEGFRKALFP